jgi:hypothetical protein
VNTTAGIARGLEYRRLAVNGLDGQGEDDGASQETDDQEQWSHWRASKNGRACSFAAWRRLAIPGASGFDGLECGPVQVHAVCRSAGLLAPRLGHGTAWTAPSIKNVRAKSTQPGSPEI